MYANNQKFGVRDEVPLPRSAPKTAAPPNAKLVGRCCPQRAASAQKPSSNPLTSSVQLAQTKIFTLNSGKNSQPLPSQQNSTKNEPGMNPELPGMNPEYPGTNPEYPGTNPEKPGISPEKPGMNPEQSGISAPHMKPSAKQSLTRAFPRKIRRDVPSAPRSARAPENRL